MIENKNRKKIKHLNRQGQAIAEFAIALPILLAILIGIFEVGRYVFIYSAVTNASRNAVRYASAVGLDDSGTYHKYTYCDGIKDLALKTAYLVPVSKLTVTITYDEGPSTSTLATCDAAGGDDADVLGLVGTGDRVKVTVDAVYAPMLKLIPLSPRTISSTSYRTILGVIDLDT